jgi:hypothetical protein
MAFRCAHSFLFAVVQRLVESDEQAELVEGRSQTP